MNPVWQARQYEPIAFVQDVLNPHPKAGVFDIGDTIILYVEDDEERKDPVYVRLIDIAPTGRMAGEITRASRRGRGDRHLAEGAAVEFEDKHIFRLEKAI